MDARILTFARGFRTSVVSLVVAFALLGAAPALAKSYSAERFDVAIRVLAGGALEVTETIVFRFEDGPFEHVFRDLPTRRTDGIEVVSATMDGRELPVGDGPGQVEISGDSRVRVRWRFQPISGSRHTFALTYIAKGVVQRAGDQDLLTWRVLPAEHAYEIDGSAVTIAYPVAAAASPRVESNRIAEATVEPLAEGARIAASRIRRNGTLVVHVPFAAGSMLAQPPAWQQRRLHADALAPRWMLAAGLALVVGLILIFAQRQQYHGPLRASSPVPVTAPPAHLPPALGGALASNGKVTLEHAMATLFALADRGEIAIAEEPKSRFGQRHFTLRRLRTGRQLTPVEQAVVAVAFKDREEVQDSVPLAKARSRVTHRLKPFSAAVRRELSGRGFMEADRERVRAHLLAISIGLLLLGVVGLLGAALIADTYFGWPVLVPAAVLVAAVIGFIVLGTTTPLSDEGARLAAEWRAFHRHLKDVAQSKVPATADSHATLLAFAVALGLASAWSKFVKQHPATAPAWFHALSTVGAGHDGFPAFIAAGGASAHGGGGGVSGGGAAGGGASGAG